VGVHFDGLRFCCGECLAGHTEEVLSWAHNPAPALAPAAPMKLGKVLVQQQAVTLRSIADAAVRIAATASRGSADRMQHARCEPFMRVRLEGQGRQEDLLVPLGVEARGAEQWPVASTQH
jgi:hypothetical protein